jgi:hypothetical protein
MHRCAVVLALLLCGAAAAAAQSNQLLDQLLEQPEAHFGNVVSLTLAAAKMLPNTATAEEAIQSLQQKGWNITLLPPEAPILLGDYAYLLMKAFDMGGGILYSLLPGPRYACRELGYLKLIQNDARPLRTVSGEEVVRILGGVMAYREVK